jgi:alkylhydroperoxidase family enzyme
MPTARAGRDARPHCVPRSNASSKGERFTVSRLKFAEPSPEEVAARVLGGHQPPPNMQKVVANAPAVAAKQYELLRAISEGMDLRLKEMVILCHAKLTSNSYCWGHHVPVGIDSGLSVEEILAIREGNFSAFGDADRAVLQYVVAAEAQAVTDAVWAAVAQGRSEKDLVCLTMLIGYYSMQATTWSALVVPQDDGFGGFETP